MARAARERPVGAHGGRLQRVPGSPQYADNELADDASAAGQFGSGNLPIAHTQAYSTSAGNACTHLRPNVISHQDLLPSCNDQTAGRRSSTSFRSELHLSSNILVQAPPCAVPSIGAQGRGQHRLPVFAYGAGFRAQCMSEGPHQQPTAAAASDVACQL